MFNCFIYTGHIINGKPETDENNLDSLRVSNGEKGKYYKDGNLIFTYTGKYVSGMMNGYGEQVYSSYTKNKIKHDGNDVQTKYSGEFKNDMIHGIGTVYLEDDSYLQGSFVNNQCAAGTWYDKN